MDGNNWMKAKSFITSLLADVKEQLDEESIEAVEHYVDHDEYEMAFEGLFIELIKLNIKPSIDTKKILEIGKFLNLNQDSVFDDTFWDKLINYLK